MVPHWSTQMWWPVLLSLLTQDPVPLVPRRGQWPLLVLPSHPKKEYALLKNNMVKLMACAISGDAIVTRVCIVATLPGTGVTADFKVEKSRSRYLGGKIP